MTINIELIGSSTVVTVENGSEILEKRVFNQGQNISYRKQKIHDVLIFSDSWLSEKAIGLHNITDNLGATTIEDLVEKFAEQGYFKKAGSSAISTNQIGVADLKPELKATFEVVGGSIDWDLGVACYFEMIADTNFVLTNIVENKVMTFEIKGNHAFTITGGTILNPNVWSDYDGSKWNLFHLLPTSKGIYVSLIKQE